VIPKTIYPWQTRQWQQLITSKQQNRLPHALLFVGSQGLGKKQFALAFAHATLCNKSESPCGQCHTCHLIQSQLHPDLLLVEPEQTGQIVKVDQIREVVQFVSETALLSTQRIVIINPANAMNMNAANALLKTLEEPAPNAHIILISDQNLRLPATITSRCQKIIFQKPSQDIGLDWLKAQIGEGEDIPLSILLNLADGAPLRAKEIFENGLLTLRQDLYKGLILLTQGKSDPLQLAAQLQEQDMLVTLNLMILWLQDLLRFKLTNGQAELINFDYQSFFAKVSTISSREKLLDYFDHVKKIYTHLLSSLNLNRQLMLEELFIRWIQYAAR
jgi:DNA polymerase-3 subunit delta'